MEVDIDGHTYHIDKLRSRQQRHILKRLMPLVLAAQASLGIASLQAAASAISAEFKASDRDLGAALGPLTKALSDMSDADMDFIFDTCFAAVKRRVDTSGWQSIIAGTELRYQDITLPAQFRLVFYVLKENFADFSLAFPGPSSAAPLAG
jgi:hypothetical protein